MTEISNVVEKREASVHFFLLKKVLFSLSLKEEKYLH